MRLDPECIRDILLEIESFSKWGGVYVYDPDNLPEGTRLADYSPDTIMYHVRQCNLSGYLLNCMWSEFEYVAIEDLTPEGHAFVSNTRVEERWLKTKSILSKLGGASLKIVSATAEGVTTAFLNKYMDELSASLRK